MPGGRPVPRWWRAGKPVAAKPWNRVRAAVPPRQVASTASKDDGRWHEVVQGARLAREAGFWAVGAHQAPGGIRARGRGAVERFLGVI